MNRDDGHDYMTQKPCLPWPTQLITGLSSMNTASVKHIIGLVCTSLTEHPAMCTVRRPERRLCSSQPIPFNGNDFVIEPQ